MNYAVVKKVGDAEIHLEETKITPPGIFGLEIALVAMCILIASYILITCMASTDIWVFASGAGAYFVVGGGGSMIVFWLVDKRSTLAYKISSYGCYVSPITIIKTTPSDDQVAICKAVQQIEAKLVAVMEAERAEKARLQEIAGRCK